MQQGPRSGQPRLHRAGGPAKLPRRLHVRLALPVAEQDWQPQLIRQGADLLFDNCAQLAPRGLVARVGGGRRPLRRRRRRLPLHPGASVTSDAEGDAVEPVGQGGRVADGSRPPDQDQKRRLEAVRSLGVAAHDPAADAQNHGSVPANQGREGIFVAPPGEALQQCGVGQRLRGREGDEVLQLTGGGAEARVGHGGPSGEVILFPAVLGRGPDPVLLREKNR